jgi:bifunctional non-homologous end joining protein LigD
MIMGDLDEYNRKRDFGKTPEPAGRLTDPGEMNRFVVQRHMARREHYDFRLQLGSTLVSWAIPKKPVYDPTVKRLAIRVEDHPLDYIHFEGIIPRGNYGAGTVMVWDIGYYYLDQDKKFPSEAEIKKRIAKGSLKLYLQGVKLKGFFNLVKGSGGDNEQWLFMKAWEKSDETGYEEKSAISGRTMEEIASSGREWNPEDDKGTSKYEPGKGTRGSAKAGKKPVGGAEKSGKGKPGSADAVKNPGGRGKKPVNETASLEADPENVINKIESQDFPGFIKPMLATLAERPFSGEGWIFEVKYDGYRVIATRNRNGTRLYSRNGNDFNQKFTGIAGELAGINTTFVIDGEICFIGDNGTANFQKLQHISASGQENIHYYVFDLLWLNGHDLTTLPLTERKKLLALLLKNSPGHIHYVEHIEREGEAFFADAEKNHLEGIIAKQADGRYYPGNRTSEWLKIKTGHRQEMIICGYMPSDKASRAFSSLLCAVNRDGQLVYTGRVGTGFSESAQKKILGKLQEIVTDEIPVSNPPKIKGIRWVRPVYICEVRFSDWTREGVMRHPSFLGIRSDKPVEDIIVERGTDVPGSSGRVKFSNLNKVFWPEEGITKGDVIGYYRDTASYILPYLKDRPQSLYRTPEGIVKKGFFQKNMKDLAPEWAETVKVESGKSGHIEYLLCQDADTLLFMANLGCIEINPWSSRLPRLDNPDLMIFDLDPVDVEFEKVLEIALAFKKLFDRLSLPAYCKTSGSRGLHIYIPVKPGYSWSQVQNFVRTLEKHIHKQFPGITSLERSPSKRQGKIYLDFLQNAKGKTMSSVYSIRPRPGATVSAPLHWDEVREGVNPEMFNIRTMRNRLAKAGDIWKGIFENSVDIGEVLGIIGKDPG